ncbi:MAG: DUF3288 family protein [Aphanothece sp. CMT-3BRIN-NPC111]|jgi:hypothetical protein|nr:DUF3288 family protein [Aphanothece sp. CMT-3BRIN-NPC111]
MASAAENKDQNHPQASRDREIVNRLLEGTPDEPLNLAELARLRIRYCGFPGARDIQRDLDKVLGQWQMEEAELFEKTRQIHAAGPFYKVRSNKQEQEDWT